MNRLKLLSLFLLLVLLFLISIMSGSTFISIFDILDFILKSNIQSVNYIIIENYRLPRTIIAIIVGMSLSISGVLIQALTRNSIASPGILGINSSAMFFIVVFSSIFKFSSMQYYLWSSFFGATFAGVVVWAIGTIGSKQMDTIRIVLAGSAITALFYSFTQAFLIINKDSIDDILFWLAGSVATKQLNMITPLLPYCFIAIFLSFFLSKHIDILAMGDETAKGLGQNINLVRFLMAISIIFLAGSAVSIAGVIGFVGLVIPHIAKKLFPKTNKWIIPASALLGANILLISDIIARTIILPREVPIGVITALIGSVFFIYLILKRKKHE